jgi:hypothetical protein
MPKKARRIAIPDDTLYASNPLNPDVAEPWLLGQSRLGSPTDPNKRIPRRKTLSLDPKERLKAYQLRHRHSGGRYRRYPTRASLLSDAVLILGAVIKNEERLVLNSQTETAAYFGVSGPRFRQWLRDLDGWRWEEFKEEAQREISTRFPEFSRFLAVS